MMFCSVDVGELTHNWLAHARTIDAKCKSTFDDSGSASPLLSCSTFEGASECSAASDADDIEDVIQEYSQWQSVSSRLAGVLRRQLQDDALVDVSESLKDCHAIGNASLLVTLLSNGIAVDSDEVIASNPFSPVSRVSLQEGPPWESVSTRIAGVFQRQLWDEDDVGERTEAVERRYAADSRMAAIVRGFHSDEPNEDAQELAQTGDLENGDFAETVDTHAWNEVGARLSRVLRSLADTELQNDSDDDSGYDCLLPGQSGARRLDGVFGRPSTCEFVADEERVSPERWQKVGYRMAAVFREASADDGAL